MRNNSMVCDWLMSFSMMGSRWILIVMSHLVM